MATKRTEKQASEKTTTEPKATPVAKTAEKPQKAGNAFRKGAAAKAAKKSDPDASKTVQVPSVADSAPKPAQEALKAPSKPVEPAKVEAPKAPATQPIQPPAPIVGPGQIGPEVIVGHGPEGLYVSRAEAALEKWGRVIFQARGRNILRAVNALEILKRARKGMKVGIESRTDTFTGRRGEPARVTALAITVRSA